MIGFSFECSTMTLYNASLPTVGWEIITRGKTTVGSFAGTKQRMLNVLCRRFEAKLFLIDIHAENQKEFN